MECIEARQLASAYVDDQISSEDADALRAHLSTCIACNRALRDYRQLRGEIQQLSRPEPPAYLRQVILAHTIGEPSVRRSKKRTIRFMPAIGYAAAVAGLAVLLAITLQRIPSSNPPAVAQVKSEPEETYVAPDGVIWVEFNQPMDKKSVEQAIKLQPSDGTTNPKLAYVWENNRVGVKPQNTLTPDSTYVLVISPDAKALSGKPIPRQVDVPVHTAPVLVAEAPPTSAILESPPISDTVIPGPSATMPATPERTAPAVAAVASFTAPATITPVKKKPTPPSTSTSTDTPTPTEEPAETPSETPTLTATSTLTATLTVTSTATVVANSTEVACAVGPDHGFGAIYTANPEIAEDLGCTTTAENTITVTEQLFQTGRMLYRPDLGRVYVLYGNGALAVFSDTTTEVNTAATAEATPSDGLYEPSGPLGRIWAGNPTVRESLGDALGPERSFDTPILDFEHGLMLLDDQQDIYVLHGGMWQVFQPAPSS